MNYYLKEVEEKIVKFADGKHVYLAIADEIPSVGKSATIRVFETDDLNYYWTQTKIDKVINVENLIGDIYAISTNSKCYYTKISSSGNHENLDFGIIYERPRKETIPCFVMEFVFEKKMPCNFEKEIVFPKNTSHLANNIYLFRTRHGIYLCYYKKYMPEYEKAKEKKEKDKEEIKKEKTK